MNILIYLLITTFIATSFMTMFSYVVSASFRKLYKEPLLLKYILVKLKISISDRSKEIFAWLIHYAIGFIFVVSYYFLWLYGVIHFSLLYGFYLGAISGLIGIISWIIMLNLSEFNHKAKDKGYYIQLFIAHIIFGIVAMLVFPFIKSQLNE